MILDLGNVAVSATISVDGKVVGSVFAPPFTVDMTAHVSAGEHMVEIDVANSLANHFATETPNDYRELLLSMFLREDGDLLDKYDSERQYAGGLLEPVRLRVEPRVTLPLS
nr:hypothetical protein [Haladaptatus halobius]